jgi:DNA-directed RNA polymerase beta subunit
MQRQAVPLLFPDAPLAGTGLEEKAAADSGAVVAARRAGTVEKVTAEEIVIDTGARKGKKEGPLARLSQYDRYSLKKFWRTNQDTAINQRPIVTAGQKVVEGQVLADGAGTDMGALALGRNVTVAFMPWYGHNFEDAIVISEALVKNDAFTSVHIQELELHVRDTKRGTEEVTAEIPNVVGHPRGAHAAPRAGASGRWPGRGRVVRRWRPGRRHPALGLTSVADGAGRATARLRLGANAHGESDRRHRAHTDLRTR